MKPVYSTSGARDGSGTARVIRDAVRKCPHESAPSVVADPDEIWRTVRAELAGVAQLLSAAEKLLEAVDRDEAAEQLLASAAASESDELLREAVEREALAASAQGQARSSAIAGGYLGPWPPQDGARELASLCEPVLNKVAVIVQSGGDDPKVSPLAAELESLKVRLVRIQGILGP